MARRFAHHRQRVRWTFTLLIPAVIVVLTAAGSVFDLTGLQVTSGVRPSAETAGGFTLCSNGVVSNCVVDGDTIRYQGRRIRLADIDTPETHSPRCESERALGEQATERLLQLINAGPFEILSGGTRDSDRYGRALRLLVRDGRSLGDILVSEGLARRWDGARHPWC